MNENSKNLIGVVIDPGHGGIDSGAQGNEQKEKDYTLMISNYMYNRFKELGIPVAITREIDETLTPNERTQKILNAFGNNKDVIVISNHLNAGGGSGAEVIYALRNNDTLAKNILNNLGEEGQIKRKVYQRRLPSDLTKDYYFIHRNTGKTEPVIIEYGFIDDKPDNVRFLNDNYKRLAEAVIKAVTDYKGLNYNAPLELESNTYTVQKGDNLYKIANIYNTTIEEIKTLNNLVTDIIRVGQILRVPTTKKDNPSQNVYIVKKGDTLYSIAAKFNTTVDNIKNLNNLTSNTLQIGQTLKIKEEKKSPNIYTVQKGDNLYSIARKFTTTIDEIKKLNNLTSNLINIGQILKIPNNNRTKTTYKVKLNDNLYTIANQFGIDIEKLKKLNNLTSNYIKEGQIIILS